MGGVGAMSTILALNQGTPMNFLTRNMNKVHVLPEIRLSSLHDKFSDRKSRRNLGLSTLIWEGGRGESIVVVVCQFP